MKKLYYLIVIVLISSLVLTGCLLSNVGQVPSTGQSGAKYISINSGTPICFDFEDFEAGEDVTVPGKVWDYLEIGSSDNGLTLEVIKVDPDTLMGEEVAYNTSTGINNGCLNGNKGFGPVGSGVNNRPLNSNNIVFEFKDGVTVSTFSIEMFDYGDYIHFHDNSVQEFKVILIAHQKNGGSIEIPYIINDGYPISTKYDACKDGKHVFAVTGEGINKVELKFEEDIDIGVGFDDICFTPECKTDLIAGNPKNDKVDAGDVRVGYIPGNDYLTVTYNTEDGWLMDEIHFHVSTIGEIGFPAKNGNPIPGQFDYKFEGLGGVDTYSFDIPLAEGSCGPIYFAAHAKVFTLADFHGEIVSTAGSDTNVSIYYNEPTDLLTPGDADVNGLDATAVHCSSWSNILSSSAIWISADDPDTTPPDGTSTWMLFKRTFEIPMNAINISGTLEIKSDNAERVIINGNLLECENPLIWNSNRGQVFTFDI